MKYFPSRPALALLLLASGCAPSPRSERLFVSDERGDAVVVLDARDGHVLARWRAGRRPRGLRLSPDGQTLYVAVSGSPIAGPGVDEGALPPPDRRADGIAVVDTATGTVRRVLAAGTDPESFALTADGRTVMVANEDAGTLSVVATDGTAPVRRVAVGAQPEGVAVSPDGTHMIVASEAADEIAIFDTKTWTRVATVKIAGRPRTALALRDGTFVVAVETAGKLAIVSAVDGAVLRTIDLARDDATIRPMGLVEAPEGKTVFVTTGRGGTLLEVDPVRGAIVRTLAGVGERPWGVALAEGGKTIVTANGPSGDVTLIDRGSGQVRARPKVGLGPWGVAGGVAGGVAATN